MAELILKHFPGNFDDPQWFPDETKPLEQRLAEQFMLVYNQWKGMANLLTGATKSVALSRIEIKAMRARIEPIFPGNYWKDLINSNAACLRPYGGVLRLGCLLSWR